MNDLMNFLTSEEIIIVYIIAAVACLISIIVYLVEKNNDRLRKKHNTKELNKLVEEIRAVVPEEELAMYDDAILDTIMSKDETPIDAMIGGEPMVIGPVEVAENEYQLPVIEEAPVIEEELVYTSIEPDEATAKLELQRIQEQLEREEMEIHSEPEEIVVEGTIEEAPVGIAPEPINQYELEQEQRAIISMDELLSHSRETYEANELTQYEDEGNEPISIQDLEIQVQRQAAHYDEPFIIANVVPEEELQAGINEAFETVEVMHIDDMNTITPETVNPVVKEEKKRFVSSPIISPIFGIERDPARDNALALENTANFEKLDAAIRKNNNEFYVSLNELEGKE